MFTYTINGQPYRTETELTNDELEELTNVVGVGTPAPKGNYLVEALRQGPAETLGMLAGAGAVLTAPFTTPRSELKETPSEIYGRVQKSVSQPILQFLGSTGAQPQTGGERIIAQGAKAVTDPLSYAFPPLAAIKRLGIPAQILARPVEQQVVGMGGEAGGQAGEYAGQKVDAPVAGRLFGGIVGGATTSSVAGGTAKTVELGATKGLDLAKREWSKIKGTVPEDELLRDVDNRISNVFIAAGAADPKFMDLLNQAAKAQESVSLKTAGRAKVEMPISALLADNPVINSFIQSLSAKDPVFRSQYANQFEAAKNALTQNQLRLFGDPSKVKVEVTPVNIAKVQERKVRSIDDQIADLSKDQTLDPTIFGQRVASLVNIKEQNALKEVAPLYTEAFNIAKAKNVNLPSSAVDDIYNFVASEQASDIFKSFPTIFNRVKAKFRPEVTQPSAILTAEGAPMTQGGMKFSAATVEDLDSLKREINKQLRKTSEPADIRLLTELKSRVGGHIDSLDPEFVTAYRNADNSYLQKVGLPFSSETLKSIDRKKFVEQISPAIIGNKSNVVDFINATGEEGVRVARDAFLDSFTKAALKNDVIDVKAANKWLANNKGGVSLIPNLADELKESVNNVQSLILQKNRLNTAFKEVAGEQIVKAEGFTNPQELVNKMYSDINFTNKFMSNSGYGQNKDAVNAARSFLLDDIVRSNDPVGMLNDRNKAAVFNRVFGPTYAKKVQDFALVSSRLSNDISNVPFRGETVPRTPIEELTGIPPEQIISRIYNPVSGPTYAITSLFSKFWANKSSAATEEKLKALLLNPSDAVKVFQAVEPKVSGFDRKKIDDAIAIGRKYGIRWIDDAVNDLQSGAARGGVQQLTNEQQPQEQQPVE
jgi:hypothetical protein